jgi:hypothetical protein
MVSAFRLPISRAKRSIAEIHCASIARKFWTIARVSSAPRTPKTVFASGTTFAAAPLLATSMQTARLAGLARRTPVVERAFRRALRHVLKREL